MALFVFLSPLGANAQDAIFSQFYAASLYLNPAFAGTSQGTRLVLNYRNHPFPDTDGLSTLYASVDTYVPRLYGGLAVVAASDNQGGLLTRSQISGVYAYHLRVSNDLFVNFGAQVGYYRQDINWNRLEFANPDQPPPDNTMNQTANFAAGMMVFNDWIYGGIGVHHLTQPRESFFGGNKLQLKYTAHLGMLLEPPSVRRANTVPFEYFVSPNIIFQQQGVFRRINLGLYGGIEPIMGGVWYRHNIEEQNALVFLIGFSFGNYRIGYSYDHSFSGYSDALHAAHEISISFEFLSGRQKHRQNLIHCIPF